MGFALRKAKPRTRFSQKVRAYLIEKFERGERTGSKFDPRKVAESMPSAMDPQADPPNPLFSVNEFLTWQQIASFWSTYARTQGKRQGAVMDDPTNTIEEMHDEVYLTEPNLEVEDALHDELVAKATACTNST